MPISAGQEAGCRFSIFVLCLSICFSWIAGRQIVFLIFGRALPSGDVSQADMSVVCFVGCLFPPFLFLRFCFNLNIQVIFIFGKSRCRRVGCPKGQFRIRIYISHILLVKKSRRTAEEQGVPLWLKKIKFHNDDMEIV